MRADIENRTRTILGERIRTVHDARRLLTPCRGRRYTFRYVHPRLGTTDINAVFVDVYHDPRCGFKLRLKGLPPSDGRRWELSRWARQREYTIALREVIYDLPQAFDFLLLDPQQWPVPGPFETCVCGERQYGGRFCGACGRKISRSAHLGDGWSSFQAALRETIETPGVLEHGCGALVAPWQTHCTKCGRRR